MLSDCQKIRGSDHDDRNFMDAVTDPLVGIISDNRDPAKGEEDRFISMCDSVWNCNGYCLRRWDLLKFSRKFILL